jgi:hypothetical protein
MSAEFTDYNLANEFLFGPLKAWKPVSDAIVKKSMDHIHEAIKKDASKSKEAVGALCSGKLAQAENTHRLLLKLKKDKDAESYMKKAKDVYPYSTYF